jgi:hypothetical protein
LVALVWCEAVAEDNQEWLSYRSRAWFLGKGSSKIQKSGVDIDSISASRVERGTQEWPRRRHRKARHLQLRPRRLPQLRLLRLRFPPQPWLRHRNRKSRCASRGSAPAMKRMPRENSAPGISSAGTTIPRKCKPRSARTRKSTAANFAKHFTSPTRSKCLTALRCAISDTHHS